MKTTKEIKKRIEEIEKEKQKLTEEIYNKKSLSFKIVSSYLYSFATYGLIVFFWTFIFWGAFNKLYGTEMLFIFPTGLIEGTIQSLINKLLDIGGEYPSFLFIFYLIIIYGWLVNPLLESIGDQLVIDKKIKRNYLSFFNLFGLADIIEERINKKT